MAGPQCAAHGTHPPIQSYIVAATFTRRCTRKIVVALLQLKSPDALMRFGRAALLCTNIPVMAERLPVVSGQMGCGRPRPQEAREI